MTQSQQARIGCRRWFCKNTTAQVTGGLCGRCTKAKQNLGWFFCVQPAIRIASWPFLFLGGIGLAIELVPVLRGGAAYEQKVQNLGLYFLRLAVAVLLLCTGFALRWLATVNSFPEIGSAIKELAGIFKWSGRRHPLEGARCPRLCFYDKRKRQVTTNDFSRSIVVLKNWTGSSAEVIDRKIWKAFDDQRITFLYVYSGKDQREFQEMPTPKWDRAKSLLLHDRNGEIQAKLGPISGPNCLILDGDGVIRRVPKYSTVYCNEYYDTPVVKKLLKHMAVEQSISNTRA